MNKFVVLLTAVLALFPAAVVLAQSDPHEQIPAVGPYPASALAACIQYDVTIRGCETRLPPESTGGGQQMNLAAQDAAQDSQVAADTLSGGAERSEDETGGAASSAGISKVSDDAEENLAVASTQPSIVASTESSASASTGTERSSRDAAIVRITRLPDSGGLPGVMLLPFVMGGTFLALWALLRSVGG